MGAVKCSFFFNIIYILIYIMSLVFNGINVNSNLSGDAINIKKSVKVATTINGTLATTINGSIIDGVTIFTNDRILLKNQTNAIENGIYIVQASGKPIRSADFNIGSSVAGIILYINEGIINEHSQWICTNDSGSAVVGTDNIIFLKFGTISNSTVSSITSTSTTSTTYVPINGMTITPKFGTYYVSFSGYGKGSNNSKNYILAIFSDGIIIQFTERQVITNKDTCFHTQAVITVNGSQVIEIRWKRLGGIFTMHKRSMILMKLS